MSEQQLERIQFVTTYYDWLQGLRFVPFGLVLLGFAAWMALPPAQGVDTHDGVSSSSCAARPDTGCRRAPSRSVVPESI